MSTITRTYTFTDGTTAYGSQVESEISNIVTTWNNHDAGTSRWTVMDATTIKSAGFTAKSILQIVTASTVSQATTTSATLQNTNLAASITPKSTSSVIVILITGNVSIANGTTNAAVSCKRGSTDLATTANAGFNYGRMGAAAGGTWGFGISFMLSDSPNTTSSTTYTVTLASSDGATTVGFPAQNAGVSPWIVLIECL